MIKFASVLLFSLAAHGYYIDDGSSKFAKEKIVGGVYVSVNQVPYQAQILRGRRQICGGTIISEEWILTAAHCTPDSYGLSVTTGSSYRGQGQQHTIENITVHVAFDSATLDNDIALIKLDKKIQVAENQKPIAIATKASKTNDKVNISGFGKEGEELSSSSTLKLAVAPVIDQDECQKRYVKDKLTDNMFCAGTGQTDACQGDSGGPAVIDGQLSGIISSGEDCGSTVYPGVYTQVYNYRRWIAEETGLDL